jgi:ribosomal protein L10
MAITRQKKEELIKDYIKDIQNCDNLVIVQQSWVNVPDATKIRKSMFWMWWKFNVIRKRLFLRALKEAWYEEIKLEDLDWSVVALYATWDQYWPLKVVNKFLKEYKKDKKQSSFSFLWWWFDKKWYNGEYIDDLANMPTKEELISKLAYIFNYPLQWFAGVLDQISKKIWDAWSSNSSVESVETKVEEAPVEAEATTPTESA